MKIIHINHSDLNGGAARATYRIHQALLKKNLNSKMLVNESSSGDWTVEYPTKKIEKAVNMIKPHIAFHFNKLLKTENKIIHSPALFSSNLVKKINISDAEIIHLHWFQQEMLSISDLSKIKKPIVWTLHDMWAFCGAEHYTTDKRWQNGYNKKNRPKYEKGFDLNLWTWNRKKKYWKNPLQIVSPSKWLNHCVTQSNLMQSWSVKTIPHPIDMKIWKSINKNIARENLNLPKDIPLILFGAIAGSDDPRKGFDLLVEALRIYKKNNCNKNLELVVFGQKTPKNSQSLPYPVHYMGHLYDDLSLCNLYNAADTMIVPSRQEAFGLTAQEANACGTPVIAFQVGGLNEIVDHKKTGYLAKSFDVKDLSNGLDWVLTIEDKLNFKNAIIEITRNKFSENIIANNYIELYQQVIKKNDIKN